MIAAIISTEANRKFGNYIEDLGFSDDSSSINNETEIFSQVNIGARLRSTYIAKKIKGSDGYYYVLVIAEKNLVNKAIKDSLKNAYISESIVIFGEVGLTGEIRPVPNGEARVKAAMKHNFKNIMLPQANKTNIESKEHNLISVKNVSQALD